MAYTMPTTRSFDVLEGTQAYPNKGSLLDIERFVKTSVPAGSNGRIVTSSFLDSFAEANTPGKKVRLIGNNTIFLNAFNPLTKANIPAMINKMRAKGTNYIRIWGPEIFLCTDRGTAVKCSVLSGNSGDANYNATAWDEFDFALSEMKKAGIYYGFVAASYNLTVDAGATGRFGATVPNTTGAFTANMTGNAISSVTVTNGGSGYFFPPIIYTTSGGSQGGYGARFRTHIDGPAGVAAYTGTITSVEVIDGGYNFASAPTLAAQGNTNSCGWYAKYSIDYKDNLKDLHSILLNHINPYTGLAYKDDPALAFVECQNEADYGFLYGLGGNIFPEFIKDQFWTWLGTKYGHNIATLNSYYANGSAYANFRATPTDYRTNNEPERWVENDFATWNVVANRIWYEEITSHIRSTGYPGFILNSETSFNTAQNHYMAASSSNPDLKAVKNFHGYLGLNDSWPDVNSIVGGLQRPAKNSANLQDIFWNFHINAAEKNTPIYFGETGFAYYNRYRAEMGIIYPALASMYDVGVMISHEDNTQFLNYGTSNSSRSKGIYNNHYECDPLQRAAHFISSLSYLREDYSVLPITYTKVYNKTALNMQEVIADYPSGPSHWRPPSNGYNYPAYQKPDLWYLTHRIVYEFDPTDNATIGNTFRSTNHTAYENMKTVYNIPATGTTYKSTTSTYVLGTMTPAHTCMMYSSNNEYFIDQISNCTGANTDRTQAIVCFSKQIPSPNYKFTPVKNNQFITKDVNNVTPYEVSSKYEFNMVGDRFFKNLVVDYIEDGTFLAITSANLNPISTTDSIIIVAASQHYNTGATFKQWGQKILSIPITTPGSGYTNEPPTIYCGYVSSGITGQALVECVAGVPTRIRVLDGGANYASAPTLTVGHGSSGGSGFVPGTPVMGACGEEDEIQNNAAYSGIHEGWPILQKSFKCEFTITGIDITKSWKLYALDFMGNRINAIHTVKNIARGGLDIVILNERTTTPTIFYELAGEGNIGSRNGLIQPRTAIA